MSGRGGIMATDELLNLIKIVVLVSVFYVWVVRYENIVKEFEQYELPNWLRDLVGITKLVSVYLINFASPQLAKIGAATVAILMLSAIFTHIRIKNPVHKMLPSTTLFLICATLYLNG